MSTSARERVESQSPPPGWRAATPQDISEAFHRGDDEPVKIIWTDGWRDATVYDVRRNAQGEHCVGAAFRAVFQLATGGRLELSAVELRKCVLVPGEARAGSRTKTTRSQQHPTSR